MSTKGFLRSDWGRFLTFLFLILLVPFSYKFGSSFNAILPIFCVTGAFANFLTNFKSLLPVSRPCCTTCRRLPHLLFGAALSL